MKDEKIFLKKLRSRSPSKELENTFITDIFLFINQIKYCEFCKREISKTIKIICAKIESAINSPRQLPSLRSLFHNNGPVARFRLTLNRNLKNVHISGNGE